MMNAEPAGDVAGIILAAVVDDQNFDTIDPVDLARQGDQRFGQAFRFIIAGDLDNQLHDMPVPLVIACRGRSSNWVKNVLKAYG